MTYVDGFVAAVPTANQSGRKNVESSLDLH